MGKLDCSGNVSLHDILKGCSAAVGNQASLALTGLTAPLALGFLSQVEPTSESIADVIGNSSHSLEI